MQNHLRHSGRNSAKWSIWLATHYERLGRNQAGAVKINRCSALDFFFYFYLSVALTNAMFIYEYLVSHLAFVVYLHRKKSFGPSLFVLCLSVLKCSSLIRLCSCSCCKQLLNTTWHKNNYYNVSNSIFQFFKIAYYTGNEPVLPDDRDKVVNGEKGDIKMLQKYVTDHFPGLEDEPAIVEQCIFTVSVDSTSLSFGTTPNCKFGWPWIID